MDVARKIEELARQEELSQATVFLNTLEEAVVRLRGAIDEVLRSDENTSPT